MKSLTRILFPLLALLCVAAAKRQPQSTVRFHTEANSHDTAMFATPVQFQYPPHSGFIEKIPVISERDVSAIFPFPTPDGTQGCAFRLDEHGKLALDTLSIDRRGQSVMAFVNGRQMVDIVIDKRVSDGVITIPRGLTAQDIALLTKSFPIVGQMHKHE